MAPSTCTQAWPRERLRAAVAQGSGFRQPSWPRGGMQSPPQLLSVKQSWHFAARQRRWLPALEVSVWPLSQHCLPSPSPLTSQTKGPNRPIVIPCRGLNVAIDKPGDKPPPTEGTSSSLSRCPWPKPSPVWVGGLAVAKAAGSQSTALKAGLLTEGTDVARESRDPGVLGPRHAAGGPGACT